MCQLCDLKTKKFHNQGQNRLQMCIFIRRRGKFVNYHCFPLSRVQSALYSFKMFARRQQICHIENTCWNSINLNCSSDKKVVIVHIFVVVASSHRRRRLYESKRMMNIIKLFSDFKSVRRWNGGEWKYKISNRFRCTISYSLFSSSSVRTDSFIVYVMIYRRIHIGGCYTLRTANDR